MESSINSWTAGASPIAIVHNRLVVGQSTSRSWLFPGATVGPAPQFGENELVLAGLRAAPSAVVKPPRILESPVSLECKEWGTLQIGDNRVVIGLVKRVHLREELFDVERKRVRSDKLFLIGRMASPHWYCRTRDRFEMIRPE